MPAPAQLLGFHIVSPTSAAGPIGREAMAAMIAAAVGPPVDLELEVRPGWTRWIVHLTREQFTAKGAPAVEKLFESLCEKAGAHFARTFAADQWARIEDSELAGAIDAIDWMQYFGPRFGGDWLARRRPKKVTARHTGRGAEIVVLPIDPFAGAWPARQDAAKDLKIELRPIPAAGQAEIVEAKLRANKGSLPPEPVAWLPQQRRAMFDARVATMKAIETGMADPQLFGVFRQTYLPGKLDEPLLDRIASWLKFYGADRTTAAFRSAARLQAAYPGAAPLNALALEGCVKLVSWGGYEIPLKTRERITEHIVSLAEPGNAEFARQAPTPEVIQGMVKLTAAMIETCPCVRCQTARAVGGGANV